MANRRTAVLARLALVAVGAIAVHRIGMQFYDQRLGIATAWPGSGLWLGMVLLSPKREWPATIATIIAVSFLTDLYQFRSLAVCLGFVGSNIVEVSLGAWTIYWLRGPNPTFTRVADILALMVVATLVNAIAAAPGAWAGTVQGTASFWTSYATWWTADALGILLVTPCVVSWAHPNAWARIRATSWSTRAEALVFGVVWCVAVWVTFEGTNGSDIAPFSYILVCMLAYAALRLGMRIVSTAIVVLAGIALHSAVTDGGLPLDIPTVSERITHTQLYVGIAGITGFLLVTSTTERRTAEAAATEAKERLRIAVNAARMGAWIYDVDTRVVHWSEEIEEIFGLAPKAFGQTYEAYLALIHPDDRAEVAATIRSAVGGKSDDYTVEHRVLHPSGEERWIEGVGRVFRDDRGRAVRLAGTVVDITRRKESDENLQRALRSLRTEEAKVRQFVKHTPVAVAMFDRDMRYIAASARWHLDYELGDQDLTGRSHYDVFPHLAESWRGVHERVLTGVVERRDEELVQLREGRTEWIEWEIRPWLEEDGQIGGVIIYTQLISKRKKLEEQLRQAQKMEAIGQLAGGVAHDFNNIIATILMQAESVRGDVVKPEVAEALTEIIASSERAANLTRQLLAFGRRQLMQLSIMNINELVSELGSMLGRVVGAHVTMRRELHPAPLYVNADAGMLDQVLVNLVVNARDAMPEGGELVIRTTEVMLDEEAVRAMPDSAPGRYVALSVRDTGIGIQPSAREHLFEPFYTTKPVGKGTGLGLPMVFGIVKQHRGQIRVHSEPGRGSTFEVLLPASGPPSETAPQPPKVTPQGGPETILVVEDDPVLRRSTSAVLRKHGYRVLEAATAFDALTLFDTTSEHIHLLLTDIVMPDGMNGFELAAQLTERRADLRVIYTSGYSPELASQHTELVHGHNFLQKPAQPIVILATLRAALDR